MNVDSMIYRVRPDGIGDQFSEIIDVRSPGEFREDRIAGAINLPVLSDEERAMVGTIDRQRSPFEARKIGAALVSRNIAEHLEAHFASLGGGYRPLVYCWRGGMRSQSLATVLASIGWRTAVLEGGYKAFRGHVRGELDRLTGPASPYRFRVVAGLTGSGKTELLRRMAERGIPVLDLEKLANHRGSILGREVPKPQQPSQKAFENQLVQALAGIPEGSVVHVEAESSKIGEVFVPKELWNRLRESPVVELDVPAEARVDYLLGAYAHFPIAPDSLKETLIPLRPALGGERLERWFAMIDAGDWRRFVAAILREHYDPAYTRSRDRIYQPAAVRVIVRAIDESGLDAAIDRIVAAPCPPAELHSAG